MNELSTLYEQFIVPLSPFLWLSGVALLLICLEILLNESHSKIKLAIAGLGALGGLVRSLDLYHQYPLIYNSGAGVGGRWLVAFAESFEVSPLTLKLSAGICFITLIALFLAYDHFKKQDYLGETPRASSYSTHRVCSISGRSGYAIAMLLSVKSKPTRSSRKRVRGSNGASVTVFRAHFGGKV